MKISIVNDNYYVHDSKEKRNVLINSDIFQNELFDYSIVDRSDLIDNLIMWISECGIDRNHDKELMKTDLKYLMDVKDDYIFSAFSTNEYIVSDDDNFEETCRELIALNKKLSS